MKYLHMTLTALLAVILCLSSRRVQAQPVSCSSGYIDNPQSRKFCSVLLQSLYNGYPLEAYPDEMRTNNYGGGPVAYKNRLVADYPDMAPMDKGTKRQDVDHVFLRFGRRR